MLIDWEQAGASRAFEIWVPDVIEAKEFYGNVFGAREVSREMTAEGKPVRLSLAFGSIQFTISSGKDDEEEDRPRLSLLAAGMGVPFVAIMLHVENLDRMAYEAEKNGAQVSAPHESGDIVVLTDPFGSHWVLKRREKAGEQGFQLAHHRCDPKTRH
jgi:predicted enzyme related to lactoylglutathione lyase